MWARIFYYVFCERLPTNKIMTSPLIMSKIDTPLLRPTPTQGCETQLPLQWKTNSKIICVFIACLKWTGFHIVLLAIHSLYVVICLSEKLLILFSLLWGASHPINFPNQLLHHFQLSTPTSSLKANSCSIFVVSMAVCTNRMVLLDDMWSSLPNMLWFYNMI